VPIVIVRVTSHQGGWESHPQGKGGTGGQAINCHAVREMRRATVALSVTCRLWATGVTTGERSDTETVTLRSERGDWKRAIVRWDLASRLLNLAHPFSENDEFFRRMYQVASTGVWIVAKKKMMW
jgi:hypothetical protein